MRSKFLFLFRILLGNVLLLILFVFAWADSFERLFHDGVIWVEALKIGFCSMVVCLGLFILLIILNGKSIDLRKTYKYSIILTFVFSSYLYITYSVKIYQNRIHYAAIRASALSKAEKPANWYIGSRGKGFSNEEYQEITRVRLFAPFPKLPVYATNISYAFHKVELLLPDFGFELTYDVPKENEVKLIKYESEGFAKHLTFEIIGDLKRVKYVVEYWWVD